LAYRRKRPASRGGERRSTPLMASLPQRRNRDATDNLGGGLRPCAREAGEACGGPAECGHLSLRCGAELLPEGHSPEAGQDRGLGLKTRLSDPLLSARRRAARCWPRRS
jgi:hypothetical protein